MLCLSKIVLHFFVLDLFTGNGKDTKVLEVKAKNYGKL
jgi:hypothetical protein